MTGLRDPSNPTYPCVILNLPDVSKPNIASAHPFPIMGLPEDLQERAVVVMLKILAKMRVTGHQYRNICPKEFEELENTMLCNRKAIWVHRKTYPESYIFDEQIRDEADTALVIARKTSGMPRGQDTYRLWDTLFVIAYFISYSHGSLCYQKQLLEPLPEEARLLVQQVQASGFIPIMEEVLKALETKAIPFKDVVKIICGGSLEQRCTVCNKNIMITEVRQAQVLPGCAVVFLNPIMTKVFRCGSMLCEKALDSHKMEPWFLWMRAMNEEVLRHTNTRCDFCFKFAPVRSVHRCARCLTKQYCGASCRGKDWDLVHKEICKGKGEKRKIKDDKKTRTEGGEKLVEQFKQMKITKG